MATTLERRAHLAGELEDVAWVRHSIGDWLRDWELPELVEDVELVASELITNAILHAGGHIDVVLERRSEGVRVLVRDGRADLVPAWQAPPSPAPTGDDDLDQLAQSVFRGTTTGRGLLLVDAFSDAWGVEVAATGKEVWAELGTGRSPGNDHIADRSAAGGEGTRIRLLAVPVRLVLLSAANLDDLVRELQTTDFDMSAPNELAALGQRLVHETLAQREPLRVAARAALQQRARRIDVDLDVPPSRVGVLRHLVSLTGQVERFCRDGVLLSEPPGDEVTAFRWWYVEELERQVRGGAPVGCPFPG